MNIIDALIMTIGFDSSKFDRDARAANASFEDLKGKAKKQGDDIERHAKFAGEAINLLATKIIAVAAGTAGGVELSRFIENITKTDASIGRLAASLGISANKLGAWDLLGRRVGGAAGEVAGALSSLNDQFMELKIHGQAPTTGPLAQVSRFGGVLFNPFAQWQQQMRTLARGLQAVQKTDPGLAHKLGVDVTGSETLTQALLAGGPDLEQLLTDAEQLVGLTKADVDAAKARQAAYVNLEAAVTKLGEKVSTSVTPALLYANDLLLSFVQKANDSLPQIEAAIGHPFDQTLSDLRDFETIFTGNAAEIKAAWFHAFRGMVDDGKWWADQAGYYSSSILPAMQGAFTSSINWIMGRFSEIYAALFGHPLFTASLAPAPGGASPQGRGAVLGGGRGGETPLGGRFTRGPKGSGGGRGVFSQGAGSGGSSGKFTHGRSGGYVPGASTGPITPQSHPYRYGGKLSVGGEQFDYVTGGAGRGSSPPGDYSVTGYMPGHLAGGEGRFALSDPFDPKVGGSRQLIRLHATSAADINAAVTSGCFGVPPSEWPALKQKLFSEMQANGGKLTMHVFPDGSATISGGKTLTPQGNVLRNPADAAKGMIGMHDRTPAEKAKIEEYLRTGGHGMDPATKNWCAAFVSASLRHAGLPDAPQGDVATAYMKWGVPVKPEDVRSGDVMVGGTQGKKPGDLGGHVAIVTGPASGGRIPIVEGDQRDDIKSYGTSPGSVYSTTKTGPEYSGGHHVDVNSVGIGDEGLMFRRLGDMSKPGVLHPHHGHTHVHVVNHVSQVTVHSKATNVADALHDIRPALKRTFAGNLKDYA